VTLRPARKGQPDDRDASGCARADERRADSWSRLGHAGVGDYRVAVNFWAWALLSPLGPSLKDSLALSSFQQALLVAIPVIVGSVGRIPVGALTDRFGGSRMFPIVSFVTILPVLFIGLLGHSSYPALLVGGLFLGIGGTAFAVGVPFVNAWFPPERRGLAVGIFGMGMGGTAISALTTVRLVSAHGFETPFVITAIVLAVYGLLAIVILRDAPGRTTPAEPLTRRLAATARLPITWRAALLYAVGFGGYVAFSVYLVTDLENAYGLAQADAANRMAGFVLLAVLMRPIGGWLSDRIRPTLVLAVAFAIVTAAALGESATPSLMPEGTIAFLVMAAALGTASGAVFALVAQQTPAAQVGAVTGVVGAAGGLGGFVPPLVMGAVYGATGSYSIGLILLAVVAALAIALSFETGRHGATLEGARAGAT
jgi:NNP family nitrate/nitrite transporter-like MFS transporter